MAPANTPAKSGTAMSAQSSELSIFKFLRQPSLECLLEDWAGEKIFKRGKEYFRKNYVKDMVITKDARLLATVEGTRNYVSALWLNEDGDPVCDCDCPYEGVCKHVAALALTAREAMLEKKALPACAEFDFRPGKLAALNQEPGPSVSLEAVRESLGKMRKDDLLELLLKACEWHNDILILCAVKADPDNIGIQALLNDARYAINEAASVPAFDDYASQPDYCAIAGKLRSIVASGKPEAALDLATEVFATCARAIEVYDVEGSMIGDVGEVADAALAALREIDWPPAKKLLWAINAIFQDEFGYCECMSSYLLQTPDSSAWADVADYLARLENDEMESLKKSTLVDLRKLALEKSGRTDELLRLYEREAKDRGAYLHLVDFLLSQNQYECAEQWIKKGLKRATFEYESKSLRERLIRIREKQGDQDAIIALRTDIFVDFPDMSEFKACAEAARAAGQWEALKPLLVQYLIEGKLPWLEKSWPCKNKGATISSAKKFPRYLELEELALAENRPLDALKWYDEQRKKQSDYGVSERRLAEAIKDAAPERAFTIWQRLAVRLIAETNTRSYFEAGEYLEKMLALAAKLGNRDRWAPWLGDLREKNKRKRNFIKILDAVEQGKKLNADVLR